MRGSTVRFRACSIAADMRFSHEKGGFGHPWKIELPIEGKVSMRRVIGLLAAGSLIGLAAAGPAGAHSVA
jgi:hypothetical protein